MTQDPFMNIKSPNRGDGGKVGSADLLSSPKPSYHGSGQVTERQMWTLTTFTVYPNGMMFVKKTQSWFDKKQAQVKKKQPKPKLDNYKTEQGTDEI